jgi:hypothetical protein
MDPGPNELMQRLGAIAGRIDEARSRFGEGGTTLASDEVGLAFVRGLVEDVTALASMIAPTALSPRLTPGRFKDLLVDERHRIRLHDSLVGEVRTLRGRLAEEHFPVRDVNDLSFEDYLARVEQYEALAEPLMAVMAAGGYWGGEEHARLLGRCLARLADTPGDRNGVTVLLNLRLYPALLLTYACGIGAVLAGRFATLNTVLVSTRTWKDNKQVPLVQALTHKDVIDGDILKQRPELERHGTPISDHLFGLLKESLELCAIDEVEYQRAFDRFEYLYALVHGDLHEKESPIGHTWGPIGCFLWRRGILEEVGREITDQVEGWPPLRAGLFGGSLERLKQVKEQIDGIVARSGW